MKKTVIFLLALLSLSTLFPTSSAFAAQSVPALGTSAASVVLFDAASGKTLYERRADARMLIASTTKIMTALIVLENKGLEDVVEIKPEYVGIEGSSMYLKTGERLSVRDLLYGLMLSSGNDAAVALACYTAGSVPKFAELMNARAARLGCENSSFKNPHGLDADGHYSSARDLAKITAEAMKQGAFRDITSTKSISIAGRSLQNHNKLLWSYDGMVGGKTGYTKSAGRSLVTCAERDGMLLVCVTLSDPDDWDDHTALYDWAFDSFRCVKLSKADVQYLSLPVISGVKGFVSARPGSDFTHIVSKGTDVTITIEAPRFVYAGVIKGARAGRIVISENGEMIAEVPLVYSETVKVDDKVKLTRWEKIKWAWYFANSRGLSYNMGSIY